MLNFAIQTARDAGRVLSEKFGRAEVSHKGDIDLVTEADLAAERLIVERIRSHHPRHSILSEEAGEMHVEGGSGGASWKWVVDPLDGTTNYAHGYPVFCVSIALEHDGRVVVGAVYDPTRDEMFAAERGAGATLNGRPIRASDVGDLNRALVCTGFPYDVRGRGNFARQFSNFIMHAQSVRRDGAAALDLAYVACGRFDCFYEDGLRPWDVAAGLLLVEEAGGRVTDYDGAPFRIYSPPMVATNGLIHDAALAVLRMP